MRIINIFDAARDGTYEEFLSYYTGDINVINENIGLNLLTLAMVFGGE